MANIIVNEPGTAFPQHDLFVNTLVEAARSRDPNVLLNAIPLLQDPILKEDLISKDDKKGQVAKGLQNWDTWGCHYLPAFIDAHLHKMTTNFMDASLQAYATPATRNFINAGEVIFMGVTRPIPSCNNGARTSYTSYQFAATTLNSQGGCFSQGTEIRVIDDDESGTTKLVKIKDIHKGMKVESEEGFSVVRCLVVSPATEMINLGNSGDGDFWVSRNHPLKRSGGDWGHAYIYIYHPYDIEMRECYNLVLESNHTVKIQGFIAVTLGHDKKGGIVEHSYLGSEKIITDLSEVPGWEEGCVYVQGFKRDQDGYICGIGH
jgi:hypothetical protein